MAKFFYKNLAPRRWIRRAGAHVDVNEIFESPVELNDDGLERVKKDEKPDAPAKEVKP